MKKIVLLLCVMFTAIGASAQFEKGKWFVNSSLSGLNLNYDTDFKKMSLGVNAQGGTFLAENLALLINAGASWNNHFGDSDGSTDLYSVGVGGRYYFSQCGIYLGAGLDINRWVTNDNDRTLWGGQAEVGYAYFLSRTVTIEPSLFWKIDKDKSKFGARVGFGFYF